MSEMLMFTNASFEDEVLKAEGLVLVDFFATWCTHSKRLRSILREVAELHEDRLKIGKLDVFTEHPLPQKYRILTTPTVLFFRNGEEVARMAGPAAREHLKDKVEELLAS